MSAVEVCRRCRHVHPVGCCGDDPLPPWTSSELSLSRAVIAAFKRELLEALKHSFLREGMNHEAAAQVAAARVSDVEHQAREDHERRRRVELGDS